MGSPLAHGTSFPGEVAMEEASFVGLWPNFNLGKVTKFNYRSGEYNLKCREMSRAE